MLPFSSQVKRTAQQRSVAVGSFRVEGATGFVLTTVHQRQHNTVPRSHLCPFYEELSVPAIQAIHKTETLKYNFPTTPDSSCTHTDEGSEKLENMIWSIMKSQSKQLGEGRETHNKGAENIKNKAE